MDWLGQVFLILHKNDSSSADKASEAELHLVVAEKMLQVSFRLHSIMKIAQKIQDTIEGQSTVTDVFLLLSVRMRAFTRWL